LPRNSALLDDQILVRGNPKDGWEKKVMNATKPAEQSQDSRRENNELDTRYGKIGISAVAAAVRCKNGHREKNETRAEPYERD